MDGAVGVVNVKPSRLFVVSPSAKTYLKTNLKLI